MLVYNEWMRHKTHIGRVQKTKTPRKARLKKKREISRVVAFSYDEQDTIFSKFRSCKPSGRQNKVTDYIFSTFERQGRWITWQSFSRDDKLAPPLFVHTLDNNRQACHQSALMFKSQKRSPMTSFWFLTSLFLLDLTKIRWNHFFAEMTANFGFTNVPDQHGKIITF